MDKNSYHILPYITAENDQTSSYEGEQQGKWGAGGRQVAYVSLLSTVLFFVLSCHAVVVFIVYSCCSCLLTCCPLFCFLSFSLLSYLSLFLVSYLVHYLSCCLVVSCIVFVSSRLFVVHCLVSCFVLLSFVLSCV